MSTTPKNASPWAIGLLLVIVLTAGILMIANRLAKPTAKAPTTQTSQATDAESLVARVAKHIVVNAAEKPSIAVVQDPELLKTQNAVFYKDAQVGDRLFVWSDKIVLYSTTRDVILAVASMNGPAPSAAPAPGTPSTPEAPTTPTAPPTEKESANIEIRNGSGRSGMAKSVSDKLVAAGLTVLPPGNASGKIPATIIVKVAGKELPQTVEKLKELLGAEVAELPAGESAATGDILVIVGANYKP